MTILIYELEGDTELVAERRQQTYSSSYIFVYTALKARTTHQSGCLSSNYRLPLPYAQLITGIFVVFFFKYTKAYLLISKRVSKYTLRHEPRKGMELNHRFINL